MDEQRLQKILTCLSKHPEWGDRRVSKAISLLGTTAAMVKQVRSELPASQASTPTQAKPTFSPYGISKVEFFAQYDPTTRMRNCLKAAVGHIQKNIFYKDHEMRRLVGCTEPQLWSILAADPVEGFRQYRFELGGIVWWTDRTNRDSVLQTNVKAKEV